MQPPRRPPPQPASAAFAQPRLLLPRSLLNGRRCPAACGTWRPANCLLIEAVRAAASAAAAAWHFNQEPPAHCTPLPPPALHWQVARKRQLTDELVQIRTQKAEVLRQIQAIAKRQKTGGLPTKAAELLAGNNKLVLQMEQRNRAEKVRRRAGCCFLRLLPCCEVQRCSGAAAGAAPLGTAGTAAGGPGVAFAPACSVVVPWRGWGSWAMLAMNAADCISRCSSCCWLGQTDGSPAASLGAAAGPHVLPVAKRCVAANCATTACC